MKQIDKIKQQQIDKLNELMADDQVEVSVIRDAEAVAIYEGNDGRVNVSLNADTFAEETIKQLESLWNMFKIRTVRLAELQGICSRQYGVLTNDSGYRVTMNDAMLALEDENVIERIKYDNSTVYVRLTSEYLNSECL